MKKIAITGSYASGKSFVMNLLDKQGFKTFSCDAYVKTLYEDKSIITQVTSVIDDFKYFDKKRLMQIINDDPKQRKKLEQIIHPLVKKQIFEFAELYHKEDLLFFEVPLLFEKQFDIHFEYTITVYCDEEIRLQRAKKRDNFTIDIYNKLAKIQLPQLEKIARADYSIDSGQETNKIVKKLNDVITIISEL